MNAIANSTRATIPIEIEVIAFGEVRRLRYGSPKTDPASAPTPTHANKTELCSGTATFSERNHWQERWDDRDDKRK